MSHSSTNRPFVALTLCIASIAVRTTGCAGTRPLAYRDLASSSQLKPNIQDKSERVPYSHSEPVDWHLYSQVIVEPVVVYQGVDAQFKKVPVNSSLDSIDGSTTERYKSRNQCQRNTGEQRSSQQPRSSA